MTDLPKIIVHRAEVTRNGKRVKTTFDLDGYSCESDYRKSWSIKKYVDEALAHLNLTPAWDMTYGWSL